MISLAYKKFYSALCNVRSKALNVRSKALNVRSKALNVRSKALNGLFICGLTILVDHFKLYLYYELTQLLLIYNSR